MSYPIKKVCSVNGQDLMLTPMDIAYERRVLMLSGEVTDESALDLNAAIRALAYESRDPITLYINSPGGSVSAGMSICDTILSCRCPITTVATGMTASIAAVIFALGNLRYINQNAEILIHQPLARMSGQVSDLQIHVNHALRQREKIYRLLSKAACRDQAAIAADAERDHIMSAQEAVAYGIADQVGDPMEEF